MQEYKVVKVSEQEPKKWDGPNGTVYYIKTMLQGHDKPVSIGKKSADALKAGDTVYGEIQPTDYIEDKFKAGKKPFNNGGYNDPAKQADIAAQWALGRAYEKHGATPQALEDAKWLYMHRSDVTNVQQSIESSEKKDWVAPEVRQKLQEAKKTNDELDEDFASLLEYGEPADKWLA